MRVMHWERFVTTSFWNCFCAEHHQRSARGAVYFFIITEIARWSCFDCILAIGVAGTAVKNTKATFSLHHKSFFAHWTWNTRVVAERARFIFFDKLAFWVATAGNKTAKATFSFHEICFLAFVSELARIARSRKLSAVNHSRAIAIRVFFAREKFPIL